MNGHQRYVALTKELEIAYFFAYEWHRNPNWNFQEYRIPALTFWYIIEGNRRLRVSGTEFAVEPGSMIVLKSGDVVSTVHADSRFVPIHYFSMGLQANLGGIEWTEAFGIPTRFPARPGERTNRLLELWRGLVRDMEVQPAGKRIDAGPGFSVQEAVYGLEWEARLKMWLALVTDAAVPFMATPKMASDPRVRKLCAYMRSHLAEPIQAGELSRIACLSEGHMRAIFREATGQSPGQYMVNMRLDKVKELLVTTELSLPEIASLAGFESVSYLISMFRRREGITPMVYRKRGVAWEALPEHSTTPIAASRIMLE